MVFVTLRRKNAVSLINMPEVYFMTKNNLDALFNPENIAVVGASNNPNKAGYVIINNLLKMEYPKKIFPVNNREDEILGLKVYNKLSDIPEKVELVVLITPSRFIFEIMDDLEIRMQQRNDVKVLVCAAADFAETRTKEGIERQNALMTATRKYGIRVVGPNCIGVIDNRNRVDTTFVETLLPKSSSCNTGGISFISQSGSIASSILMLGASQPVPISFNKFVSIGNMADVDFIDLLEYFEVDRETKVIGIYLEGYPKARKLLETMARIVKKKPIVVLKVGRSEKGAYAANSHTGSLAGADRVYDGSFKQYGIIRVQSIEELMDTLQAFDKFPIPQNGNMFILSQAGGPGIICADSVSSHNVINLPAIDSSTKQKLKEILPPMASICRPEGYADITASATVFHHTESLKVLLDDPNVAGLIFITVIPTFLPKLELAEALVDLLVKQGYIRSKPVFTVIMAGNYVRDCRSILEQYGIYTFETPDRAVKAAANLIKYGMFLKELRNGGDIDD
jgi:acyl-CoA synthetase (NDP forming)